jgi:hypothetical protein
MSHTVFAPIIRLEKLQVPRLFVGLPSSYRRRFWNAAYEVPMKAPAMATPNQNGIELMLAGVFPSVRFSTTNATPTTAPTAAAFPMLV